MFDLDLTGRWGVCCLRDCRTGELIWCILLYDSTKKIPEPLLKSPCGEEGRIAIHFGEDSSPPREHSAENSYSPTHSWTILSHSSPGIRFLSFLFQMFTHIMASLLLKLFSSIRFQGSGSLENFKFLNFIVI
jgi:hypothetical protein